MTDRATRPDDLLIDEVAARLGKSVRWVQALLGRGGYDFHHYIGRSPRWDEREYQALRAAVIAAESARRGRRVSPSSDAAASGTLSAPSGPEAVASAFAKVLAFQPARTPEPTPKRSGRSSRSRPTRKQFTASIHPLLSR